MLMADHLQMLVALLAQTDTHIVAVEEPSALTQLALAALTALSPALIAILGWVAKKIADLINANIKSRAIADALIRFDYAVINAVKYVEQTARAEIKLARSEGSEGGTTVTKAEAAQIKAKAIAAARSFLGERGIDEVLAVLGIGQTKLDELLSQRVEAAVLDLRTTDKAIQATADLPRLSLPPAPRPYPG